MDEHARRTDDSVAADQLTAGSHRRDDAATTSHEVPER
jgi:hypothetical protein